MKAKSNYCTFYLVRHGETLWNKKGLVQGHGNSRLTKLGISQAKDLAKKLKGVKFDLAFSSDLLRAKKTAQIIALEHKLKIQTTKALREQRLGKIEGANHRIFEEMDKLFATYTKEQVKQYFKANELEPTEEFISRFLTYLREIALTYREKTILVVTHGGVIYNLLMHLGFWGKRPPKFPVSNTSYVKLESDGVEFFVKQTEGIET